MAAKQLFNTEAGLRALKEELDYLKNTKRNEVKENLALARSFGDLSENSESDEAKKGQSNVESRTTRPAFFSSETNSVKVNIRQCPVASNAERISRAIASASKMTPRQFSRNHFSSFIPGP